MHLLVTRFSSLGDVALCLPAMRAVLDARPDVRITFITRPKFASLFQLQERLSVFEADVDLNYRGPLGIVQLARDVEKQMGKVNGFVDLHDNLRTSILKVYFRGKGKRVSTYRKGRKEKKALLGALLNNEILPHTTVRYLEAFIPFIGQELPPLPSPPLFQITEEDQLLALRFFQSLEPNEGVVGIAPFAQHALKCLPEIEIRRYARQLVAQGYHVCWLGGGIQEKRVLEKWSESGMSNLAGRFPLSLELALLKHFKWLVVMDSGNMHLGALSGTPLISVWGPTHPALGFGPYWQPESVVQVPIEELSCRPCSVFGNKPCHRGDHACMANIRL